MKEANMNKGIWGLVLIALGVLFLLNQLDVLHFNVSDVIVTFWPTILIFLGLKSLLFEIARRRGGWRWHGSYLWNAALIFVGVYFLLRNLGVGTFTLSNMYNYLIPLVLILVGFNMMFKPRRAEKRTDADSAGDSFSMTLPPLNETSAALRERSFKDYDLPSRPGVDPLAKLSREGTSFTEASSPLPPMPRPPEALEPDQVSADAPLEEQGKAKASVSPPPVPPMPKSPLEGRGGMSAEEQASRARAAEGKQAGRYSHVKPDKDKHRWGKHMHQNWMNGEYEHQSANGMINRSSFIGDIRLGETYWELKPMQISHFIGDTVIDLTKANIPTGETRLNISAFIGDVKIFVPNDLQVEISIISSVFLGDMNVLDRQDNGIFKNMHAVSPDYKEAEKKIYITVSLFIGDVLAKRVG